MRSGGPPPSASAASARASASVRPEPAAPRTRSGPARGRRPPLLELGSNASPRSRRSPPRDDRSGGQAASVSLADHAPIPFDRRGARDRLARRLPADGRRPARALRRRPRGSPSGPSTRASARAATSRLRDRPPVRGHRLRRARGASHAAGADFIAISEERGEVAFGSRRVAARVVIDPIDGSLNARRTLPVPLAHRRRRDGRLDGRRRVRLRPRLRRRRGVRRRPRRGARLDGREIRAAGPGYGLEVVGLESAEPELDRAVVEALAGQGLPAAARSARSRSRSATSPPAASTGCSRPAACRSVDVAAAQLIVREAGAAVEFADLELGDARRSTSTRATRSPPRSTTRCSGPLEAQRSRREPAVSA